MKSADEELCRKRFDAFLSRFYTSSSIVWQEVAPQCEPPDYYLALDDKRFAVEVTALIEQFPVGARQPLPATAIARILEGLVDEVAASAEAQGYLHGNYHVYIPWPICDLTAAKAAIREGLLAYIRNTIEVDKAAPDVVFSRESPQQMPEQCRIEKVGSTPNQLRLGSPVWVKWEGEIVSDLLALLNQRLDAKVAALKRINVPKILLLLDCYHHADSEMYPRDVSQLPSLGHFHTVYVVHSGGGGFVLHSQDSRWGVR